MRKIWCCQTSTLLCFNPCSLWATTSTLRANSAKLHLESLHVPLRYQEANATLTVPHKCHTWGHFHMSQVQRLLLAHQVEIPHSLTIVHGNRCCELHGSLG